MIDGTHCPQRVGKKYCAFGSSLLASLSPRRIADRRSRSLSCSARTHRFSMCNRLRIRMRRLRCCRSRDLMHSSRRFLIVLLAFLASASVVRSAAAAQAYLIADAQTGYILEEQKPRKKLQVGSLTKIATACVVLDWSEKKGGDLNAAVAIPPEAFQGTTENNIGFQPGDNISLRDLLYAALVQSDNIAAATLAYHVGSQLGSVEAGAKLTPTDMFVAQMNALAKQLKMERTRFVNPHGIDWKVKPLPYSTAEDMARLTRYAMNKPSFRFYVSQKERQISFNRQGHQTELRASQHERAPRQEWHRRSEDRPLIARW